MLYYSHDGSRRPRPDHLELLHEVKVPSRSGEGQCRRPKPAQQSRCRGVDDSEPGGIVSDACNFFFCERTWPQTLVLPVPQLVE